LFCGGLLWLLYLPKTVDVEAIRRPDSRVLVIGSGGVIGSALVRELESEGYRILETKGRTHYDARSEDAFSSFDVSNVKFAFLLASEDGRSSLLSPPKFEELKDIKIREYNTLIYESMTKLLNDNNIPFIFISSYESYSSTSFGKAKSKGEEYCEWSILCRVVRFWTVIGPEHIDHRTRLLGRWINTCLNGETVQYPYDGQEAYQFIDGKDAAKALILSMKNFNHIPKHIEISNEKWTTLRTLANAVDSAIPCTFEFTKTPNPNPPPHREPKLDHQVAQHWVLLPRVPLAETISSILDYQRDKRKIIEISRSELNKPVENRIHKKPLISWIVASSNDGYGIDRLDNAIRTLDYHLWKYGISSELIVVEYNQRPNQPKLIELLPKVSHCILKVITVPNRYHIWYKAKHNTTFEQLYEFFAKNIGARRASGEYIAFYNQDVLVSETIISDIAKGYLRKDAFYRATRIDLEDNWSADKVAEVPIPNRDIEIATHGPSFPETKQIYRFRSKNRAFDNFAGLHTDASGDFFITHRDNLESMRGLPETKYNFHMDSFSLCKVISIPGGADQISYDFPIFHQFHLDKSVLFKEVVGMYPIPNWKEILVDCRKMSQQGLENFHGDYFDWDQAANWGIPNEDLQIEYK